MSCVYKQYDSITDGPADLYHRMNQMDCALKKFGGTAKRRKMRKRTLSKKPKSRSKRRSRR